MNRTDKWVLVIFFILSFCYLLSVFGNDFINRDSDMFWHIKTGQWILENNSIRYTKDIFSFQKDAKEWVNMSWGTDITFAVIFKNFGFKGIIALCSLIISIYLSIIMLFLRRKRVNSVLMITAFIIGSYFISKHWLPRPHLLSHLFIVVWYVLLDRFYNERTKKIWLLPVLTVFWANLHQGVMYGYLLIGIFFIGAAVDYILEINKENFSRLKILGITGVLCVLATLITPYGILYFKEWVVGIGDNFYDNLVNEFKSPNFHAIDFIYYNVLVAGIVFILATSKKRIIKVHALFMVFWIYSSFQYLRHVSIMGIFFILIVPLYLNNTLLNDRWMQIKEKMAKGLGAKKNFLLRVFGTGVIIGVSLITYLSISDFVKKDVKISNKLFPVNAVEFLVENNIKGNGFNHYNHGGYILWRLYPEKRIFIDARMAPYSKKSVIDYFRVVGGSSLAMKLLDSYDVSWVLIPKEESITTLLEKNENVKKVYDDDVFVLFVLKEGREWEAAKND